MRTFLVCLAMTFCFTLSGCGGPENVVSEKVNYDPMADIKAGITSIAESGRMGSGTGAVYSAIRTVEKTDATKGQSIKTMMDELSAIKDPTKMKAKAKEILAKL
jgi:hypothetical protein